MFESLGQFYVFLSCFSYGLVLGFFISFYHGLRSFSRLSVLFLFLDVVTFVLGAFAFNKYAEFMNFPSFRSYMIIGVFLGVLICVKTFAIPLAKINKRLYNIIKKSIIKLKSFFSLKIRKRKILKGITSDDGI